MAKKVSSKEFLKNMSARDKAYREENNSPDERAWKAAERAAARTELPIGPLSYDPATGGFNQTWVNGSGQVVDVRSLGETKGNRRTFKYGPVKRGTVFPTVAYNEESGQFEPAFRTSVGMTYPERDVAEIMQGEIDDYMPQFNEEVKSIDEQLNEAYAERDRLNKAMAELGAKEDEKNDNLLAQMASSSNVTGGVYYNKQLEERRDINPEYRNLHAALNKNAELIYTLEEERDDKEASLTGAFRSMGRRF